jgi:hypothetical protein
MSDLLAAGDRRKVRGDCGSSLSRSTCSIEELIAIAGICNDGHNLFVRDTCWVEVCGLKGEEGLKKLLSYLSSSSGTIIIVFKKKGSSKPYFDRNNLTNIIKLSDTL